MKRKRFSEGQIITILQEHAAGMKVKDIVRQHGISEQTFYRWKSKYGGMDVSDARKLRCWRRRTPGSRSFWPIRCSITLP